MDKKISSTEYKKRIITEGLLCPRETIWIRASDQAVAAAWFSAGDNRFRLDVRYSDGTISIYREYENVPYNIIKIAENVAFASEENEKIGKEKMMTDRQLKDICDAYIRGAEKARNNETSSIKAEKERLSHPLNIKKVIFNGPATIIIWMDGTKTIVKCMEGDIYDPEKALMMCIMEKMLGSKANVKQFFKKWIPEVDLSELGESIESIGPVVSELGKSIGKLVKKVAKALENSVDFET